MESVLSYILGAAFVLGIMLSSSIHFYPLKGSIEHSKIDNFIRRHKKAIAKIANLLLISYASIFCLLQLDFPVNALREALLEPHKIGVLQIRHLSASFLASIIVCSGVAGATAGFLSIFQTNLTKAKRLTLLIFCLLPLVFSIITLLVSLTDSLRIIVKLGVLYSGLCWLVNAPSIIMAKHWFELSALLFSKLGWGLKKHS